MNAENRHNKAYDPLDENVPIKRIYFYMIRSNDVLEEYFIRDRRPIPRNEMADFIREIAAEITDGSIPLSSHGRGSRVWKKRSYFVYYDPDAKLETRNAVTFTSLESGDNPCFRDGAEIFDGSKVQAFYCINHMLRSSGHGPGDPERFDVHVNHGVAAAAEPQEKAAPIFTHDDSGTNTGPP